MGIHPLNICITIDSNKIENTFSVRNEIAFVDFGISEFVSIQSLNNKLRIEKGERQGKINRRLRRTFLSEYKRFSFVSCEIYFESAS